MTAGGRCVKETRVFKVGNELTNLPRQAWYYDTIDVVVKFEFEISVEEPDRVWINHPLDFTRTQQEASPCPVTR
jgi:hypothetical protein